MSMSQQVALVSDAQVGRRFCFRLVILALTVAVLGLSAAAPPIAVGDPASDLAAAEEAESEASARVTSAESALEKAKADLKPVAKKAASAEATEQEAIDRAQAIESELVAERTAAADEIAAAESDYDDEKASQSLRLGIGIGLIALVLLTAAGAYAYNRKKKSWPLSKKWMQVAAGGGVALLIAGVVLAVLPGPTEPEFSPETEQLAKEAEDDPADPPTQELIAAEDEVEPLVEKYGALSDRELELEGVVDDAEETLSEAKEDLSAAKEDAKFASNEVEREEREAAKEEEFRAEATALDYDQLIKNPYRYIGEKVVYTGKIFQIQEGFGSFMLLSVTDEGYGFWTDEVWVSGFGEIESAEEDIVTVYGTVQGAEEYDTQIGGSRYVPKIKAKYVDE